MKYGTTTKLTFNKIGLVRKKSFYNFYFDNYAGANQCTDLKQSKNHIEDDSKNTNHLISHISNSKLKIFCLRKFFYH